MHWRERRSRPDVAAEVDVSTEIVIHRPRSVVAAFAADPDNAPRWYENIKRVDWQTSPPLAVGSRIAFVAHFLGRRLAYVYEIVEFVPGSMLRMRTTAGPFPMETSYMWFDTDDGATRMVLRNRGRPRGIMRLFASLVAAAMRRANTADLARLRALLE